MRTALVVFLVLVGLGGAATAQAPSPDDLIKQVAQERLRLGACNAELGVLQQLSAQVIAGQVQAVTTTLEQLRARFEAANPGETIDTATGRVRVKAAESAPQ